MRVFVYLCICADFIIAPVPVKPAYCCSCCCYCFVAAAAVVPIIVIIVIIKYVICMS
jgi:hypothetical protein